MKKTYIDGILTTEMLQRLPDKLTQLEAGRNRMQNTPRA